MLAQGAQSWHCFGEGVSMYFAYDDNDYAQVTADLRAAFNVANLTNLTTSSGSYLFALVDTAFDHGRKKLTWNPQPTVVYAEHGNLSGLSVVSPKLLALSHPDSRAFTSEVFKLCHHCNGRPMLSFLQSKVDAEILISLWQKYLMLTTPDDKEPYLVRLADTRITPSLVTMPQTTLWAALSGSVSQWLTVGRDGTIEKLNPLTAQSNQPEDAENDGKPIEITDADLSHLLACGQPDSVINAMEENFAELLPSQQRSQFYQQVAQVCQTAQLHRIESFPDVLALAMANHLANGELLQNKELQARLKTHDWADGTLSNVLGDYMPAEVQ
jgi:hypothetical protein